MSNILIINIGIVVLFLLIFIFFYIKDGDSQKRLARYEKSLDDLNKEIYKLHKLIKNLPNDNSKANFRSYIDDIYSIIEKDREYVDIKLQALEDKLKESNLYASNISSNIDDRRIISMFKDGWSIENIAKELMITKSEVEFTLKLADIY
ncbi:hypothetical protein [Helicobacter sp. MIT 14-3879]|uniref:hypothetical protein n=1 Tax=Helicobacter sp. MIT 14-3879 TaxID=2040649 RepID=UPI000E1F84D0|nr:hypothetical protein [Helicobacter sp. MIT 14-3879]RDU62673.1 hypothetical protein CQA44_06715 [Helicobacter sp. MIT 14-3879]